MKAIHSIDLSPWHRTPPARPGLYIASAERDDTKRAYFSGSTWSEQVDEAASDADFDAARATPMDPARARSIEWRGLTERSARWLQAEMAVEPAR